MLLDANALLHRAWHALPPLQAPDGTVVNAVYGMASVALKLLKEEKPDVFIACWDTAAPTFRHEAYKAYKATREKKEQELYDQIPFAKDLLKTLGVPSVEKDGYEADDLIATLAERADSEGYYTRIVTGDRDTLQLVGPNVDVLTFKKGVSETKLFDEKAVEEEYGVPPTRLRDWKAIKGDPSDNIPGVPGIGEKGATELLRAYGSFSGIFKAAHDPSSDMKTGLRKKLLEGEASAKLAYELVDLDRHAPMKKSISFYVSSLDRQAFTEAAARFGFRSLFSRLPDQVDKNESFSRRPSPAQTKQSVSERLTALSEKDALAFLARAGAETEIAMSVLEREQGSLFGGGIRGIALGWKAECAFIPADLFRNHRVKGELRELLANPAIGKIFHDAKRHMTLLEHEGFVLAFISHDTLIAAYLLAAGERNLDADALVLQYLHSPIPEGEDREIRTTQALVAIAEEQRREMKKTGADRIFQRMELPLIPILRNMERTGILVDLPYLKSLSKEMNEEKRKIERRMEKTVGHAFNPASPAQLAVILFEELGLPAAGIKKGKTGYSTAASELEKLRGKHEIIDLMFQHREVAKLLSTYVDALPGLADANGRIHTTFNQAIAATGRLSSSEPNLQNIPVRTELGRKIRRAFIAGPGMELVACDYSQIELRVIAALSKDRAMLDAFQSGADIHTATAARIWGIDPRDVRKDQRRAAKAINFGIIYGQGPIGLSQSAGISFAEAKEFIKRYFETYKGIKTFLEETKALAHRYEYVETLFGRRRPIPDINSNMPALRAAAERMAINMPVQGTAADLLKLAMIRVSENLQNTSPDTRMLLQVHDELLFEAPKKDVRNIAAYVRNVMETIEEIGCPIVVEARHGKHWNALEPILD